MESDDMLMLEAVRRFRQLQQQMNARMYILSHSETAVLQGIRQLGDKANVSDMARSMMVSPPAISRTLRQLREKGYVDSRTYEHDRRNTYVVMTPQGRDALSRDMEQRHRFQEAVIRRMGKEQWETLQHLAKNLYECMQQEIEEWSDDRSTGKD